jgi:hypothetical protein
MTRPIPRVLAVTLAAAALSLGAWAQTMTREHGTNRRGNDYTSFPVLQAGDCEQACARDRRCRAYTFDEQSGRCFLKDRVPSASRSEVSTSGVKQDDESPGDGDRRDVPEERGIDYHGSDYTSAHVRDLGECQERCRRDDRCASYSFDIRAVVCYLKDRVGDRRRDDDKVGGVKQGGGYGPGGDKWEQRGYDYHGGDYDSRRVRGLRECQDQCADDRRCRAYSYDVRANVCYLKDRVNDRRRDSDKVTGLKPRY